MNKSVRGGANARVAKLVHAVKADNVAISKEEKARIASGELELVDRTLTIKTEYSTGEMEDLVSTTKNPNPRRGINDFNKGVISQVGDGGTVIVDAIKIAHATGTTGQDAATKSFTQVTIPADIAHGVVEFSQGNVVVGRVNISEFAYKGDEPNTRADQWLPLTRPMVLAAGKTTKISLLRPESVTGVLGFISIEMKGMQTYPKRG